MKTLLAFFWDISSKCFLSVSSFRITYANDIKQGSKSPPIKCCCQNPLLPSVIGSYRDSLGCLKGLSLIFCGGLTKHKRCSYLRFHSPFCLQKPEHPSPSSSITFLTCYYISVKPTPCYRAPFRCLPSNVQGATIPGEYSQTTTSRSDP